MKWLRVEKSKRIRSSERKRENSEKLFLVLFLLSVSLSLSAIFSLFAPIGDWRMLYRGPCIAIVESSSAARAAKGATAAVARRMKTMASRHRRRRFPRRCSIITIGVDSTPASRLPAFLPSRSLRLAGNDITSFLCHVCIHVDCSSDAKATARLQFDSSGIKRQRLRSHIVVVVVVVVVVVDLDLDLNNNLLRLSPAADAPPSGRGPRLVAPRRG